jgi:hypothetical protein
VNSCCDRSPRARGPLPAPRPAPLNAARPAASEPLARGSTASAGGRAPHPVPLAPRPAPPPICLAWRSIQTCGGGQARMLRLPLPRPPATPHFLPGGAAPRQGQGPGRIGSLPPRAAACVCAGTARAGAPPSDHSRHRRTSASPLIMRARARARARNRRAPGPAPLPLSLGARPSGSPPLRAAGPPAARRAPGRPLTRPAPLPPTLLRPCLPCAAARRRAPALLALRVPPKPKAEARNPTTAFAFLPLWPPRCATAARPGPYRASRGAAHLPRGHPPRRPRGPLARGRGAHAPQCATRPGPARARAGALALPGPRPCLACLACLACLLRAARVWKSMGGGRRGGGR